MGYVEDIQKVNNLAKDLLKNGMAESHDDALQKATQMLSKSDNAQALVSNQEKKKVEMTWQEAMSKNNSFLIEQFNQLNQQIGSLLKEITVVKAEMQQLKRADAKPVPIQKASGESKDPLPSEVSVEKVFYFGKK